ncbi:MAG: helix-turn-helix domain-containing protein [Monoglobaceae bacterium]
MGKRGRKSIYDTQIAPHIEEIRQAVKNGATVAEIATALGIAKSTLCKYMAEKPELKDAFAHGRANIIIDIRGALLKKALGYEYQEKKQYIKKDEDGESVTYTEITTKHQPPSETAGAMLLRNYDESWLDKDSISTQLKQQELELRKAIAKDNSFDGLDI